MPSTATSSPSKPADEILLSAHQVVAFYHTLRLRVNGLKASRIDPVTVLNRRAGKRWSAKRWLEIIKPHYERITAP